MESNGDFRFRRFRIVRRQVVEELFHVLMRVLILHTLLAVCVSLPMTAAADALFTAFGLPADVVELQCSRCGRSFEVRRGHHYGKYDFVYCGRGCLDAHRDSSFDASEVTGPTASAQGV